MEKTTQEEIIETVNKLFIYTDNQEWSKLKNEVFTEIVLFDMSSWNRDEPQRLSSNAICELWREGFSGIDSVHHQAGNFLVNILNEREATVFCYAIAIHFKEHAQQGNTREFAGSYDLKLEYNGGGWRINSFKYSIKFITGNLALQ